MKSRILAGKGNGMADPGRQGEDWDAGELDAIIADYFVMLGDELIHKPYVKAHHRAALMQQIGRSSGSIERKHQNISAVLMELGLPWIWGYKPLPNYQEALFEAVDRHLSGRNDLLFQQSEQPVLGIAEPQSFFVGVPRLENRARREGLERLVRKFDPVERDFRNRLLGRAGEEFVIDLERRRLTVEGRDDLARRVRWVAIEDGDGAGFDVLSFDPDGQERLIEVKTTNGAAQTPFFMTRTEMAVADERSQHWHLDRVHLFAQRPQIFTIRPPLENALRLAPETWRAVPNSSV
jgi:hypothetical protein